jgi:hypothetical protein
MSQTSLLQLHEFFRGGEASAEGWSHLVSKDRRWESFYRDRWAHDKVVRSTHGVNCTGSCSWNVYVKDGLITWESQAVDYLSTGPDMPEYEPRGCPRGASRLDLGRAHGLGGGRRRYAPARPRARPPAGAARSAQPGPTLKAVLATRTQ